MTNLSDDEIARLANAAFEQAAKKVIQRAIQTGTPVIVAENGQVKKVDPHMLLKSTLPKKSD